MPFLIVSRKPNVKAMDNSASKTFSPSKKNIEYFDLLVFAMLPCSPFFMFLAYREYNFRIMTNYPRCISVNMKFYCQFVSMDQYIYILARFFLASVNCRLMTWNCQFPRRVFSLKSNPLDSRNAHQNLDIKKLTLKLQNC